MSEMQPSMPQQGNAAVADLRRVPLASLAEDHGDLVESVIQRAVGTDGADTGAWVSSFNATI